jgi:hypothetical protein
MKIPELHRLVMQRDAAGIARLLGSGGHDIDAFDTSGKTALMYAAPTSAQSATLRRSSSADSPR